MRRPREREEEPLSQGGAPKYGGRIPAVESCCISLEESGRISRSGATKGITIGGQAATARSKRSTQVAEIDSLKGWLVVPAIEEGRIVDRTCHKVGQAVGRIMLNL